jgi:hypothetical protein
MQPLYTTGSKIKVPSRCLFVSMDTIAGHAALLATHVHVLSLYTLCCQCVPHTPPISPCTRPTTPLATPLTCMLPSSSPAWTWSLGGTATPSCGMTRTTHRATTQVGCRAGVILAAACHVLGGDSLAVGMGKHSCTYYGIDCKSGLLHEPGEDAFLPRVLTRCNSAVHHLYRPLVSQTTPSRTMCGATTPPGWMWAVAARWLWCRPAGAAGESTTTPVAPAA